MNQCYESDMPRQQQQLWRQGIQERIKKLREEADQFEALLLVMPLELPDQAAHAMFSLVYAGK